MKPIAIFRHYITEGPGYFATYLDRHDLPWQLIKLDEGAPVPDRPQGFSGLVFMGGPMSVNDDLPWIRPVLSLIEQAVQADIPVLGHCLGGQLMSKALGGQVTHAPVKEIGWGEVILEKSVEANRWFGEAHAQFLSFHWHGETFSIPAGAQRVLASPWCQNQGFVLGKHLGLQCHIEMTEQLIQSWCQTGAREIAASVSPAVQPVSEILAGLSERLRGLHTVADKVYQRWTAGLAI